MINKSAFVLYVVPVPFFVIHPTDTSAAAPFSSEFTCSAGGYGYRNIVWYRRSNTLPKKAYSTLIPSVNETTSILTIPNVTIEDVGVYYCRVWVNRAAIQSRSANLFLSGKRGTVLQYVHSYVCICLHKHTAQNFDREEY